MLFDVILSLTVFGLGGVVFYLFTRLRKVEKANEGLLKAMTATSVVVHQLAELANIFQDNLKKQRDDVGKANKDLLAELDDLRFSIDEFVITVVNQIKGLTTLSKPAVKTSHPSTLPSIKKNDNKPN